MDVRDFSVEVLVIELLLKVKKNQNFRRKICTKSGNNARQSYGQSRLPDRPPMGALVSCLPRLRTRNVYLHACMRLSAHPSCSLACWHSYLHYTVTVNQILAPRQPCRLATRVQFTEGGLQLGARGEKIEGKKKGQVISSTSSFAPFAFPSARCDTTVAFTLLMSDDSFGSRRFGCTLKTACDRALKCT